MKRVGSKVSVGQQRDEQPDDLTIPDFLRRPVPAAQRVETRQQSAPAPSVN